MRYYTIDEQHVVHGPFPFEGWVEWAKRMENLLEFEAVCRVGETHIDGDCWVSTAFMRRINSFFGGPPKLFETMVFGGEYDGYEWRYSTWAEAAEGHRRVVDLVMGRARPVYGYWLRRTPLVDPNQPFRGVR